MNATIQHLIVRPVPDLRRLSHRLGPVQHEYLDELRETAGHWATLLRAAVVGQGGPWLAVWLPEGVEDFVDGCWATSPSRALWLDALAAELVMAGASAALPWLAGSHCAPLPARDVILDAALDAVGLRRSSSGGISRRYGLLTWTRPTGCRGCLLHGQCRQGAERYQ